MLHRVMGSIGLVALATAALACSASTPPTPPKPPGVAPTPKTVTIENPGGDAADPEWAALDRLAREPWGARRDRYNTLVVPLSDARHWQRVRLWGYPTRASFRFGDEHYGVVSIWYHRAEGKDDPESCLDRFIAEARPVAENYGTKIGESHLVRTMARTRQGLQPMVVRVVDASVDGFFEAKEYAGALAAYPSWPGTCLIQGFVVVAGKHKALAQRIRDRWVTEGAPRLAWHARLAEAPGFEAR
jgi:hypothetical protein